jgi:indole-3-glycerol phosphate synthase
VLEELLERGVQPELFTDCRTHHGTAASSLHHSIQRLQQNGALILAFTPTSPIAGSMDMAARLEVFLDEQHWQLESFRVESAAAMKHFDARALSMLTENDTLRRQWLRSASRMVQRQRPLHRTLWCTSEEKRMLDGQS